MQLITCVGLGDYREADYEYEGNSCKTRFFVEAAVHWLEPDEVIVVLTPGAAGGQNWSDLKRIFVDKGTRFTEVLVPEPVNDTAIWDGFLRIADGVAPGGDVAIDVTHGFRSLPMLAVISSAYLRLTRDARVTKILYGAFDMKDKASGRVPAFDLTSFVTLFDWILAADRFKTTGNGYALARLIPPGDQRTDGLRQNLIDLSRALHLNRPVDAMSRATELGPIIEPLREEVMLDGIPLLGEILGVIEGAYAPLGLAPSDQSSDLFVTRQLELAEWYLERRQFVQCIAAAREWLPTLLCALYSKPYMDSACRDEMELLLVGGKEPARSDSAPRRESALRAEWNRHPIAKSCKAAWRELSNLRNDILHTGFRRNPRSADDSIVEIKAMMIKLRAIHDQWRAQAASCSDRSLPSPIE